jgi:hypothetical protein
MDRAGRGHPFGSKTCSLWRDAALDLMSNLQGSAVT